MRKLLAVAVGAVVASGSPALAQAKPEPGPSSTSPARLPVTKEKIICEDEVVPGTRLQMRHTCGTVSQWRAYRESVRLDMDRVGIISSGQ